MSRYAERRQVPASSYSQRPDYYDADVGPADNNYRREPRAAPSQSRRPTSQYSNERVPPVDGRERTQSGYKRPDHYFASDVPNERGGSVRYSDDDDDEDTMVQTDVSALPPPPAHNAHAKFGRNQTLVFDNTLPPDAIQAVRPPRRSGAATLAVPSQGRPRASSLPSAMATPRNQHQDPWLRQAPPPRAAPPRQPAATLRVPDSQGYRYFRNHLPQDNDEEGYGDSDEDKFTAVSTGVADDDDDDAAEDGGYGDPRLSQHNGRDPRAQYEDRRRSAYASNDYSQSRDGGYGAAPPPPARRQPSMALPSYGSNRLAPPRTIVRPSSTGSAPINTAPLVQTRTAPPSLPAPAPLRRPAAPPAGSMPEDTPEEKALLRLLQDMNFSLALKDFHNTFGIGVAKTLVASDGLGHAYCKIHCKKLPRAEDLKKEPHLEKYWIPLSGQRWQFATESHKVEVLFRTTKLAAYETAAKYGAPRRS